MIYVMSDPHGEYSLFKALMEKIHFSTKDKLYICGDVIEKGDDSVKLLKYLLSMPNVYLIRGNHEEAFVRYYYSLMAENNDYDIVLDKLQKYIQGDGKLLDWTTVDAIESLPYYIETDRFVCVHAGVPLDIDGRVPPLSDIPVEELLYNRRFKKTDILPKKSKCVFYGHTSTNDIKAGAGILTYMREGGKPDNFDDYIKVHLDTGTFVTGILGCFCVDNCQSYYINRNEL